MRLNVHYSAPMFAGSTGLTSPAACGIMIKASDLDGMTSSIPEVTCAKCMRTLIFKREAEKISEFPLLRPENRVSLVSSTRIT